MIDALTTDRLTIRPYRQADQDRVVELLNQLAISRWLAPIPHPFTHADLRLTTPDGVSRWPDLGAITHDGEVIGGIGVSTKLGYYLDPAHWGKGFGSEAAKAAVDCGFAKLGFAVIRAGCFEANKASAKILARLGFEVESRGSSYCTALKKDVPSAHLRLTRDRWEALQ